jgi:hypothetical protein
MRVTPHHDTVGREDIGAGGGVDVEPDDDRLAAVASVLFGVTGGDSAAGDREGVDRVV